MRQGKHRLGDRSRHDRGSWFALSLLGILIGSLMPAGCGEESSINSRNLVLEAKAPMPAATHAPSPAEALPGRQETDKAGEIPAKSTPAMPRRIIYNATLDLVVESLARFEERLAQLAETSGGFIADQDINSQTHAQPSGTWKVRVPVDRFQGLLKGVEKLGELQRSHIDSQDVSQEYYDLEARITNKQQEEKRLLKHLDDSTGKLEDILAVEREISRVRGEVEQMQGRLRFLANLSDLSTVTITASEIRNYKPPVAPTFATEIARTFAASLEQLTNFAKALVLAVVALVPWLPLLAIGVWLTWRLWPRRSGTV
jgi:hypothetical protein